MTTSVKHAGDHGPTPPNERDEKGNPLGVKSFNGCGPLTDEEREQWSGARNASRNVVFEKIKNGKVERYNTGHHDRPSYR